MITFFSGWALLLPFIAIVLIILLLAYYLSYFALGLEQKTKISSGLIGFIFLSLTTSLPELTNAVASPLFFVKTTPVFNVFGANFLTFLTIALANLFFFSRNLLGTINKINKIALAALFLTQIVFLINIWWFKTAVLFNVSLGLVIFLGIYWGFVYLVAGFDQKAVVIKKFPHSPGVAISGFTLIALMMIGVSFYLVATVTKMALPWDQGGLGLEMSLAGVIFLSLATAIPEIFTFLWLVKLNSPNLALAGILGSHLLNFVILVIADWLIPGQALWPLVSQITLIRFLLSGIILYTIFIGIAFQSNQSTKKLSLFASIAIIGIYLVNVFYLI